MKRSDVTEEVLEAMREAAEIAEGTVKPCLLYTSRCV